MTIPRWFVRYLHWVAGIDRAVSGPIPPMVKNEPGLAGCVGGRGNAAHGRYYLFKKNHVGTAHAGGDLLDA